MFSKSSIGKIQLSIKIKRLKIQVTWTRYLWVCKKGPNRSESGSRIFKSGSEHGLVQRVNKNDKNDKSFSY